MSAAGLFANKSVALNHAENAQNIKAQTYAIYRVGKALAE